MGWVNPSRAVRLELELWLHEQGYSERVVRKEILKAWKILRNELLKKERNPLGENKIMFNITYYPEIPKY